jgi:transcriptional regulator with XRE-family HTH domain
MGIIIFSYTTQVRCNVIMGHFDVVGRIKELCVAKDISFYKLSKDGGVPQSTLTNMFNRGTTPSVYTIEKICDTLGITLSQFFNIEDTHTNKQEKLIEMYNSLSKKDQELLFAYIQGLSKK